MSTGITIDDDILVPLDHGAEDRPRGCRWDESVCTSSPEYRVVRGSHGSQEADDTPVVDVYCARHYALELARLVDVHLHECPFGAADHAATFERGFL